MTALLWAFQVLAWGILIAIGFAIGNGLVEKLNDFYHIRILKEVKQS